VQGAAGLLALLCLAGIVETSRNPDRTTARLGMFGGALLLVALAVFVVRGDLLRSSGMDSLDADGCGFARSC
jgi:hypothetical protein